MRKDINGRFIDGSWIIGPAGMPMLPGAKFVVAFNAENPNYYELLDQYIHMETARGIFFDGENDLGGIYRNHEP